MIDISPFSFSVDGQSLLLSLKWPASGVEIGFEFFILKLSSIRSIYLSYDNHNLSAFLSRGISIPKIRDECPKHLLYTQFLVCFLSLVNK